MFIRSTHVWGLVLLGSILFTAVYVKLGAIIEDPPIVVIEPPNDFNTTQERHVNQSVTFFKVMYWGGTVSTYQKPSDFEKLYRCYDKQHQPCHLKLTTKKFPSQDTSKEDALLFRAWYTPRVLSRFPTNRSNKQRWVMMIDEAPQMIPQVFSPPILSLFNITIGFRRDSHIPMLFGPSMSRIFDPPLHTSLKRKDAAIIWVAHNCIGYNKRHKYVEALMHYIPIHSYGDCLHNSDWPEPQRSSGSRSHITAKDPAGSPLLASSGLERLIQQYKFYLAFENQNCEDYVSEKFYRALYSGVVPVVLGPPNIENFQPADRSVIDASKFEGPKQLADYLMYLHNNDTAYEEYMEYKRDPSKLRPEFLHLAHWQNIGTNHRGYSRSMYQLMCDLCYKLQNDTPTSVEPIAHTCQARNYEIDANRDLKKYPPTYQPKFRPTNNTKTSIDTTQVQKQVSQEPTSIESPNPPSEKIVPKDEPNKEDVKTASTDSADSYYTAVYWGGPPSTFQLSSDFERTYTCRRKQESSNCSIKITLSRSLLSQADVMVCRAWYFPRTFERLPNKPPRQKWVMMIDEGPSMLPSTFSAPIFTKFDIRMSYHQDSEVYMPFGPSLERLMEPPLPVEMKRKDAIASWVGHNCEAFNGRQYYVRALMKHLSIHSYGDCLHNYDFATWNGSGPSARRGYARRGHITRKEGGIVPLASEHLEQTIRQYKFYLAFENQHCKDYVSEKFWRALYSGAVPVVMGAPNIREYYPSNTSVINVEDFEGPKALAEYLTFLSNNDAEYEKYLKWKSLPTDKLNPKLIKMGLRASIGTSYRGYSRTPQQLFCDLCYVLKENKSTPLIPDTSCAKKHWNLNQ